MNDFILKLLPSVAYQNGQNGPTEVFSRTEKTSNRNTGVQLRAFVLSRSPDGPGMSRTAYETSRPARLSREVRRHELDIFGITEPQTHKRTQSHSKVDFHQRGQLARWGKKKIPLETWCSGCGEAPESRDNWPITVHISK